MAPGSMCGCSFLDSRSMPNNSGPGYSSLSRGVAVLVSRDRYCRRLLSRSPQSVSFATVQRPSGVLLLRLADGSTMSDLSNPSSPRGPAAMRRRTWVDLVSLALVPA